MCMNSNVMVLNYSFTREKQKRQKGNGLKLMERTPLFDEGLSRQRNNLINLMLEKKVGSSYRKF